MVSPTFDQMHFYSTGRYGLIDSFYRHVWLNLPDESMAHRIRKVFWSKSTMIVFDLTCFDNYSDTTVDSDVSLDWKIQLDQHNSTLIGASTHKIIFDQTQMQYSSTQLVNETNHCPVPLARQKELQLQMMLYIHVAQGFLWDKNKIVDHTLLDKIDEIFQSEIHIAGIKEKLFNYAVQFTDPASIGLIDFLNCRYE